jgi:CRP/FNR family transcriptional regulator, cyclic AMP receptor protein
MWQKDNPAPAPGAAKPASQEEDRVIMRRPPAGTVGAGSAGSGNTGFGTTGFGNTGFGNTGFGNSGFAPSGFGRSSGFGNSGHSELGASGIVHTMPPGMPPQVVGLVHAIHNANEADSLKLTLGVPQWQALASVLQPFTMEQGQILIEQSTRDTTVFFLESGGLSVHYDDSVAGKVRLAMLGPGSCVGEGSFFSRQPRSATVQAAVRSKLWSLKPQRFAELANRHPAVALALVMALGSVVARRLGNRPKRVAVT